MKQVVIDHCLALFHQPKLISLRMKRAKMYQFLMDRDACFTDLSVVIEMNPYHTEALLLRAMILKEQGFEIGCQ